jgi:hypothetical protein
VGPGAEGRELPRRRRFGEQRRPSGVGGGESDVEHHQVADFVAGQEMAAAVASEGHRERRADRAVLHAIGKIEATGAVDRDHRGREVGQPDEQRRGRTAGRPAGAGPQHGVEDPSGSGPGPVGGDFPHPRLAGQPRHGAGQLAAGLTRRRHPDRHSRRMERAGRDPPVAPVVPGPRGDQHPLAQQLRKARRRQPGHPAAGGFHQRANRDAGRQGATIPIRGLLGSDHGNGGQTAHHYAPGMPCQT